MYINKLDNIINQWNNAYHNAIKMKPADKKWSVYINFAPENYDNQNWLWLKKLKIICHWHI